jgi:hypothetical protein
LPIIDQQAAVAANDAGFDMARRARGKKITILNALPNPVQLKVGEIGVDQTIRKPVS